MAQVNPKLRKATLAARERKQDDHTFFFPSVGMDDHKNIPGMGYKRPVHPNRQKKFSGFTGLPIGKHLSVSMFGANRVSLQNLFNKQYVTVTASREQKTVILEIKNMKRLSIYYKQPKPYLDWVALASELNVGDYLSLDLLGCDNVHLRNDCRCPISVKTSATAKVLRFTVMELKESRR